MQDGRLIYTSSRLGQKLIMDDAGAEDVVAKEGPR